MTHILEVGKPYPGKTGPLPEGGWFGWSKGGLELFLSFRRPWPSEIDAVRRSPCELALVRLPEVPETLWLLYHFEPGLDWSDAPYTPHLIPENERPDVALFTSQEQRLFLQVVLVECTTAVVQAIRLVSLSHVMSQEMVSAYLQALAAPWPGANAYEKKIQKVYLAHPQTENLLALAQCRCVGGE